MVLWVKWLTSVRHDQLQIDNAVELAPSAAQIAVGAVPHDDSACAQTKRRYQTLRVSITSIRNQTFDFLPLHHYEPLLVKKYVLNQSQVGSERMLLPCERVIIMTIPQLSHERGADRGMACTTHLL